MTTNQCKKANHPTEKWTEDKRERKINDHKYMKVCISSIMKEMKITY